MECDHDLTFLVSIRCLEEGAEEFFLKPVKLSDVNKLRPHMMKGTSIEDEANNKERKAMVEIQAPEKTRTTYNGFDVLS